MAQNEGIYVIKKNGERELFSEEKVLRSMKRVGLAQSLQPKVLEHIKQRLHQDMDSLEIFAHIREFLDQNDERASLKFNLKQAIFDLGPTGFPFERYMQRVFDTLGYTSQVGEIMQGACVTHEIDLQIEKDGKKDIIEAKFHNQQGVKTDVQVLLYTFARFLDVKEVNPIEGVWIVTNTKLTLDASNYARCKGVKVIGWNFPENNNLQDFVERPNLYPITILHSLSKQEKQSLLAGNVIVCSDILAISDEELKNTYFLNSDTIVKVKKEAALVSGSDLSENIPTSVI
jgi:hypothetical protein